MKEYKAKGGCERQYYLIGTCCVWDESRCKVGHPRGIGSLLPCLAWGSLLPLQVASLPTTGGWGSLLPCLQSQQQQQEARWRSVKCRPARASIPGYTGQEATPPPGGGGREATWRGRRLPQARQGRRLPSPIWCLTLHLLLR